MASNPQPAQQTDRPEINLVGISIYLYNPSTTPSLVNPDSLRHNGIVEPTWTVMRPVVMDHGYSRVRYSNGLAFIASNDHVVISQNAVADEERNAVTPLTREDIVCFSAASRYLESIAPVSPYDSMSIDPVAWIEIDPNEAGRLASPLKTPGSTHTGRRRSAGGASPGGIQHLRQNRHYYCLRGQSSIRRQCASTSFFRRNNARSRGGRPKRNISRRRCRDLGQVGRRHRTFPRVGVPALLHVHPRGAVKMARTQAPPSSAVRQTQYAADLITSQRGLHKRAIRHYRSGPHTRKQYSISRAGQHPTPGNWQGIDPNLFAFGTHVGAPASVQETRAGQTLGLNTHQQRPARSQMAVLDASPPDPELGRAKAWAYPPGNPAKLTGVQQDSLSAILQKALPRPMLGQGYARMLTEHIRQTEAAPPVVPDDVRQHWKNVFVSYARASQVAGVSTPAGENRRFG